MYEPFVAEYYDHLPMVAGRRDLDLYLEFTHRLGDPILELGCGTGRILLPLAEAGYRITGLDFSQGMLSKCREKLERMSRETQQRVTLIQGNMTRFDLREIFPLIIIPFRPFQHLLSVGAQLDCLHCVRRHLAPGGKLILDVFQPDPRRMHDPAFTQESAPYPEIHLPDGRRVALRERIAAFHRAEQTNDVEMIFQVTHPDGRVERLVHAFTVRYFFRFEVEHVLARCGFRVAELFGDFDRSLLRDNSPEMIFVAEAA